MRKRKIKRERKKVYNEQNGGFRQIVKEKKEETR